MIGTLLEGVENYHGKLVTRLFRAMKPTKNTQSAAITYRMFAGIPYIAIYMTGLILTISEVALIILTVESTQNRSEENDIVAIGRQTFETFIHTMLAIVSIVLVTIAVINVPTVIFLLKSMFYSQRSYLHKSLDDVTLVRSEGQLQAIRNELKFLVCMVESLDSFTNMSTRSRTLLYRTSDN